LADILISAVLDKVGAEEGGNVEILLKVSLNLSSEEKGFQMILHKFEPHSKSDLSFLILKHFCRQG
jgi:hypothetical protein